MSGGKDTDSDTKKVILVGYPNGGKSVIFNALAEFLQIIGVNEKDAEIDACQIEHHVSPQTMKQLNKFVRDAPLDSKWLENFKSFCKTRKRSQCQKQ